MNKVKFYNYILYSVFIDLLNEKQIKYKITHRYNWFKLKSYLEVEIFE